MEFPGFYFDPKTRRLYREPRDGLLYPHLNSGHPLVGTGVNQTDVSSLMSPKPKNIISLLRHREMGVRKNPSIEIPLLKLKSEINFGTGQDMTMQCEKQISNVLTVKGGQQSIFGLWNVKDAWENVLSEVFTDSSDFELQARFGKVMAMGIQDFCDGYRDSELLMVISNDYRTQSGRVMLLRRRGEIENIEPARFHMKRSTVFSCCSNSFVRQFAIGCEHSVAIENTMGSLYNRGVMGNVHSIHYNDRGTMLYCGIHSGKLCALDLRQASSFPHLNLFDAGINELLLLSNQHHIICGSFEGDLCTLDLRMQKVAVEFLNHAHSTKKSPLSVNESLGLLCASGVDNMTRLWSLNGGVPIRVIRPPEEREFELHKAWLSNDPLRGVVHLFQNKMMYTSKI